MKYSAALLLAALASFGADAQFRSGQAARIIIGQPTFTAQQPGTTEFLLGAAGGVAFAGDTLFVADSNRMQATPLNRRVLIYRNVSQTFPAPNAKLPIGPRCTICTADPQTARRADVVLGQKDYLTNEQGLTQSAMRLPTAVASDGQYLAVADTENNRVLIWKGVPTSDFAPADVVLGQENFTSIRQPIVVDASSFRGPQGVWIQNGRLFVADTQNHRVLVWNTIPAENNKAADVVLGVVDFVTNPDPYLGGPSETPTPSNLLNPVSVTSDGTRLYVADLGHNRVVIWNDINSLSNNKPFDVVVGQPDAVSMTSNNSSKLCASNGTDADTGNPTYPVRCAATLDFPRFALSDGQRLFVADGGNDRVLIWNTIPNANGRAADLVLGQPDMQSNINTDLEDFFTPNLVRSAANSIRTPSSLAFDGTNLYVADPFDRRVLVFTPGENLVPNDGVRNSASLAIYAVGGITIGGTVTNGETVKITIASLATNPDGSALPSYDYSYKVAQDDKIANIITALVTAINTGEGNPYVLATANTTANTIQLTAKQPGAAGDATTVSYTLASTTQLTMSTVNPSGGQNAAVIAPGTLVTLLGTELCDCEPTSVAENNMPRELAGVQVYFDGIAAPLRYVSRTQINAQMPYEVGEATTTNVNAWVRYSRPSGEVVHTTAVAVPVAPQNPGIFTYGGQDPRPAIAYHAYSNANAVVSVDGSVKAADTGTIKIGDNSYTYTVQSTDTLVIIRDAFVKLINENANERVVASASGAFQRIILVAKEPGTAGNGIAISTSVSSGATLLLTALQSETCCATNGGTLITEDNPAIPGETILVYATGLGIPAADDAKAGAKTGTGYTGPAVNNPVAFVSALAGGKTANVLFAGLKPGAVGISEVWLQLNADLPDNPFTQLTIAQETYVSNIVTIPVRNPPEE